MTCYIIRRLNISAQLIASSAFTASRVISKPMFYPVLIYHTIQTNVATVELQLLPQSVYVYMESF